MELSRREMAKLSLLGTAAVALPLERALGRAGDAGQPAGRERAARALHHPVRESTVVYPVRSDVSTDYYRVTMEPFVAGGGARAPDTAVGLQRHRCPGPRSG